MKPDVTRWIASYAAAFLVMILALSTTALLRQMTQSWWSDLGMGRAGLVQLTFGVQVLLAWMAGWGSVVVVIPAMLAFVLVTYPAADVNAALGLRLLVTALAVPLGFSLARMLGVTFDLQRGDGRTWMRLFVAGIFGAVITQFGRYATHCCGALTAQDQLKGMALSLGGQICGLLVVLVVVMLWFRWERMAAA